MIMFRFSSYKPTLYFVVAILAITAIQCSTKKNTAIHRGYHNLTGRYNAYFNGFESFKEGVAKLEKQYKDDYSQVLPVFKYPDESSSKNLYPEMDKAILKASKVIQRHEIKVKGSGYKKKKKKKKGKKRKPKGKKKKKKKKKKKGKEKEETYRNWIDDSYLLIGKSNFYKNDFEKAIESFEYVAKHYKKYPIKFEALIWMVKSFNATGEFSESQAILDIIKDKKNEKELAKLKKKILADLAATEAAFYIKQKMYGPAIKPLNTAIEKTRKKKIRVRYNYILAQLYQKQRDFNNASNYFMEVLKLSPSYEMAFNAQINRARGISGSSKEVRKELEKMLNDEKNSDYFDQIYFALADLAQRDGDFAAVEEYLKLSLRASKSNEHQKGLAYLRLADIYFGRPDYSLSELYYDSASQSLSKDYDKYSEVINKKRSLKDVVKYLRIIAYEDSMQRLAGMSEKERNRVIKQIIERVVEDDRKKKEEEANRAQISSFPTQKNLPRSGGSQWYFYNSAAMSFGYAEFTKKWGDRKLEDHWRRKNKSSFDLELDDFGEEEEEEGLLGEITGNPMDKNSYLQNIPLTRLKMQESTEKLIDAYYNLGIVYKELLMDYDQSVSTFEELLDKFPNNKYRLSTLYQLYRIFLTTGNKNRSEYYKNMILKEFPNSDYAKIIVNPAYIRQLEADAKKMERYYSATYRAYEHNQFQMVIERCNGADSLFPNNKLEPKFDYLRALAIGKSRNLAEFEAALKEVIVNHPNDEVKPEAEATLALIANVKETLKDTSGIQNDAPKVDIFTVNKDQTHYYVLVVPDSVVDINKLKKDVSNYNAQYFRLNKLNTDNMLLDLEYHLIIVKKFRDSEKGIDYYESVKQNFSALKELPNDSYQQFVISSENFPVLYKDKKIENYLAFFQKNYLNN